MLSDDTRQAGARTAAGGTTDDCGTEADCGSRADSNITRDCNSTARCGRSADHRSDPLVAALTEIDRFLGAEGWGLPARLFALVPTADLLAAEPSLVGQLSAGSPDSLSSVEQEDFHGGDHLEQTLSAIAWPPTVQGVAVSVERVFLPDDEEASIPEDPDQAAEYVAGHPRRQDLRVVSGAMRDGSHFSVARVLGHPDELLGAANLVPSLEAALLSTLDDSGTDDLPGPDDAQPDHSGMEPQ